MTDNIAYWNTSKLCWEITVVESAGDRFEKVIKHANVTVNMLKDQGIKYIDAFINKHQSLYLIMIVDAEWYLNNETDINAWAESSNINVTRSGMILEFKSQEDKMMFMLRW